MAASQSPQYMKVNCMQACILLTMENTFKVKKNLSVEGGEMLRFFYIKGKELWITHS